MNIKLRKNEHVRSLKIAYGGLLIALGILLPQAFHVFGQNAGMTFLPIHIPILIAGLMLGPYYGGVIGLLVPVLSSVLTGMPPVPKLYFMLFELVTYGIVSGWLIKKCNVWLTLILTMLAGRICYGFSLVLGVWLLGIHAPFMNQTAFFTGILSGIPGMIIQIVAIPVLYMGLRRGGLTVDE